MGREMRIIMRLCQEITWSESSALNYQRILAALCDVFSCKGASIHAITSGDDRFTLLAEYAVSLTVREMTLETGRMSYLRHMLEPIVSNTDTSRHPEDIPYSDEVSQRYKNLVFAPIWHGQHFYGVLGLFYEDRVSDGNLDLELLSCIGQLLGTVMGYASSSKRHIEYVMINERDNLCAEIHDTVSHQVTALFLETENALLSFEEGSMENSFSSLEKISSLSEAAVTSLRKEMLLLKNPDDRDTSLSLEEAVRSYLSKLDAPKDVSVKLHMAEDLKPTYVSAPCKMNVVRILHESLNNAMRHSGATSIEVAYDTSAEGALLTVTDNGCGFDARSIPSGHFGISIMRDRAHCAGGKLCILSIIGKGTSVSLMLPLSMTPPPPAKSTRF